jgi:hypothetical protein
MSRFPLRLLKLQQKHPGEKKRGIFTSLRIVLHGTIKKHGARG